MNVDPMFRFIDAVIAEVKFARGKFPKPDCLNAALVEEVGEVSKALLDESSACVYYECVQVAAMALRLATEGDPTFDALRKKRKLDRLGTKAAAATALDAMQVSKERGH